MKQLASIVLAFFSVTIGMGQTITPGRALEALKLDLTYEEVVEVLGFEGKVKTYNDYIAEELFSTDPEDALECQIGFDTYVRYEYLLTLPVSYVYFKDGKVVGFRASSLPEYYHALAQDIKTDEGLEFWAVHDRVESVYGQPELVKDYDDFIIRSYFYFDKGITVNEREGLYRSVHIYHPPSEEIVTHLKAND